MRMHTGAADVLGWVARMGTVDGMTLVDFNYPQHLRGLSEAAVATALEQAGLKAGAIALRYEKRHQAGAFTHPDEALRREAIELTKEGARWALALGAGELVRARPDANVLTLNRLHDPSPPSPLPPPWPSP